MFKVGDNVRLKTGQAGLKVLNIRRDCLEARYFSCGIIISRHISEFTFYEKKESKYMTNPFKQGDRVCFKIGHCPIIVTGVNGKYIWGDYENKHFKQIRSRDYRDFELLSTRTNNSSQVYESEHGPVTLIGQRRDGAYVMETFDGPRGRSCTVTTTRLGKPISIYTVELENIVEKYTFHRRSEKGKVKLHDLIKRPNGKLYRVIKLNTNSPNKQWLEGEIMLGSPI